MTIFRNMLLYYESKTSPFVYKESNMRTRNLFSLFAVFFFLFFSAVTASADEYLNYEGFLGELRAIKKDAAQDMVKEAEDFVQQLKMAGRIIAMDKKNYYLRIEILRAALGQVNLQSVRDLNKDGFHASLDEAKKTLQPIYDLASSYAFYLIGYSHIDLAWLWTRDETKGVFKGTANSVLDLMKQYPEFIFSETQPAAYEWMEKEYPDVFNAIMERFKEGRWEFIGGSWVEMDSNLPSGESFVRQYLYGKRWFKEKFGVEVKVAWTPDSFGYMGNLPQILKKSGMVGFLTQKINWNDTVKFPYHLFWWEAPDGSRILTFFPPGGYNEEVVGDVMLSQLERVHDMHGLKGVAVIYGVGDHGGGPTKQMLDRAFELRKNPMFARVTFIKAHDFFGKMHEFAKDNPLPTVKDELYLQYHRGTYTTQAKTKWNNRHAECLLETAEKFASLSKLYGGNYPQEDISSAWKLVLFNQMHDILPGSGIGPVYFDSKKDFEQVFEKGNKILGDALAALSSKIDTQGDGEPLVVFNPSSWERTDVVTVDVDSKQDIFVTDNSGKPVLSQKIEDGSKLVFVAEKIPSIGYSIYHLQNKPPSGVAPLPSTLAASDMAIENSFYKLTVDKKTGHIISLYDKANKREVLAKEGGNIFQFFEDNPKEYDAWNIGTGRLFPLNDADKVELVEKGPVRAVLRITKTLGKTFVPVVEKEPSLTNLIEGQKNISKSPGETPFTVDITLYNNLPRIDLKIETFWKPRKLLLKLAFNLNLKSDFATFEIPYSVIERPTNPETPALWARWEESAQKWVDYTEYEQSVKKGTDASHGKPVYGLSVLNDSKYGYDIKGSTLRVTLLRGPIWPDPMADRGRHVINLSLYPHAQSWKEAGTVNKGYEFNEPLLVRKEAAHKGEFKAPFSFASSSVPNVILSVVKKHEDSNDLILRAYETNGVKTNATITLPVSASKAEEVDMTEWNIMPSTVKASKNKLTLQMTPYEIKTIRVTF